MAVSKILLIFNDGKERAINYANEVASYLHKNNIQTFVEEKFNENIKFSKIFNNDKIDFILVIGGDGTLLNFAHKYYYLDVPFYGINIGRVGALIESNLDNYSSYLKEIFNGNYSLEKRNTLVCKITDENKKETELIGFNEVVVSRGTLFKMLNINLKINSHNETSFFADGVIVATATGSTAYNLSCGGPMLSAEANNFVITPIAPQLKTITSLVINDTDLTEIDIDEKKIRQTYDETNFPIISIDGSYRAPVNAKTRISVRKGNVTLKIIRVNHNGSLFEPMIKVALSAKND